MGGNLITPVPQKSVGKRGELIAKMLLQPIFFFRLFLNICLSYGVLKSAPWLKNDLDMILSSFGFWRKVDFVLYVCNKSDTF